MRKEKENAEKISTIPEQQKLQEEEYQTSSPKRLRSLFSGPLYQK